VRSRNNGVNRTQPGRQRMLLDVDQRTMSDRFRQRQNSEVQVAQEALAEPLLLLVLCTTDSGLEAITAAAPDKNRQ
jgi:hypothetical protein